LVPQDDPAAALGGRHDLDGPDIEEVCVGMEVTSYESAEILF